MLSRVRLRCATSPRGSLLGCWATGPLSARGLHRTYLARQPPATVESDPQKVVCDGKKKKTFPIPRAAARRATDSESYSISTDGVIIYKASCSGLASGVVPLTGFRAAPPDPLVAASWRSLTRGPHGGMARERLVLTPSQGSLRHAGSRTSHVKRVILHSVDVIARRAPVAPRRFAVCAALATVRTGDAPTADRSVPRQHGWLILTLAVATCRPDAEHLSARRCLLP